MNSTHNLTLQFYKNLGKLFYAIAAVDKNVRAEEISTVKGLVQQYWVQIAEEKDVTEGAIKSAILDTFNQLCTAKDNQAEDCYNCFINFKKQNESLFTDTINSLILKTTNEISTSFSGQNKSELMMLAKLNIELKK